MVGKNRRKDKPCSFYEAVQDGIFEKIEQECMESMRQPRILILDAKTVKALKELMGEEDAKDKGGE
jgi:hypothetical protein